MILKIELEVNSNAEAYKIVSKLGMILKVNSASLDDYTEEFSEVNQPNCFLKEKYDKTAMRKNALYNTPEK